MARTARKPQKKGMQRPFRPLLLAGGLGLLWFVEFQDAAVAEEMPAWSVPLVLGVRLVADVVGAWLLVSVLRLAVAAGQLGLTRLRNGPSQAA